MLATLNTQSNPETQEGGDGPELKAEGPAAPRASAGCAHPRVPRQTPEASPSWGAERRQACIGPRTSRPRQRPRRGPGRPWGAKGTEPRLCPDPAVGQPGLTFRRSTSSPSQNSASSFQPKDARARQASRGPRGTAGNSASVPPSEGGSIADVDLHRTHNPSQRISVSLFTPSPTTSQAPCVPSKCDSKGPAKEGDVRR